MKINMGQIIRKFFLFLLYELYDNMVNQNKILEIKEAIRKVFECFGISSFNANFYFFIIHIK